MAWCSPPGAPLPGVPTILMLLPLMALFSAHLDLLESRMSCEQAVQLRLADVIRQVADEQRGAGLVVAYVAHLSKALQGIWG